jgi:hypothetical protein
MVSHEHEQRIPMGAIVRAAATFALIAAPLLAQVASAARVAGNGPAVVVRSASPASRPAARNFYPDDPLWREPPPDPVRKVAKRNVDDLYDFLDNSFVTPRREGKRARSGPHPALDTNTLGDVPDSAWYTNRHYYHRMTVEELKRGPGNSTPPANGTWRVISAKSDGVTPGFVIEDEHKNRYVLKFDPPQYPEMSSAADVIGSKAFYALGYNTPENYIVHFRRENLEIGPGVMWRDQGGKKHPLTAGMLDEMLKPQPKRADGTYRGMASRFIAGDLAGPFSYRGMRSDDPNDIIPHEDRRSLRGLAVFAAWLNHHDTKAVNSMDSLVDENGLRYLKHYLLDFGDILGSDGINPKYAWSGHEYTVDGKGSLVGMLTLGFDVPRWARADYPKLTGVGRFDSWSFDPLTWKPNYPNPAFVLMDREDAFWAAKQVAAFTDEEIRALIETGEYSDPRAAQWVADSLIKRRDKVAAAWFSKLLPVDKFRVVDGKLAFDDLAAERDDTGTREYEVRWASQNAAGSVTTLAGAVGRELPAPRGDTRYLVATVKAAGDDAHSITVYLCRRQSAFKVIGVDR